MVQWSSSRRSEVLEKERDEGGVGMVVEKGSSFNMSKEGDKGRKWLGTGGRRGVILGGRLDMQREGRGEEIRRYREDVEEGNSFSK